MRSWALAIALLLAGGAGAQSSNDVPPWLNPGGTGPGSINADNHRPVASQEGVINVQSGTLMWHLDFDVALHLRYALDPVLLYQRNSAGGLERAGALVAHRVGGDLTAAIGLFDWFEIGVGMPVVLLQLGGANLPGTPSHQPALFGTGDVQLVPKLSVLSARRGQWVDLAVLFAGTLPTAFPAQGYLGDGFFVANPQLALSRQWGGFRVAGNVGLTVRSISKLAGYTSGEELFGRAGAGYNLEPDFGWPFGLEASVQGVLPLRSRSVGQQSTPLEAFLQVRYRIWDFLFLGVGASTSLLGAPGAPDLRVMSTLRYAYRPRDTDGDGILNRFDRCPGQPEDVDGVYDDDGCPDFDRDNDGVEDGVDKCPDTAEDVDGFEDEDGCVDIDNDGDLLLDPVDQCPLEPEDEDGWQDDDGCPEADNDEDGFLDVDDRCPDRPGTEAEVGCPDDDRDGDGLANDVDACPEAPEDRDGFKDTDGCPDEDDDGDGILDVLDVCPKVKEDFDGFADEDGCPDLDNDQDSVKDADDRCPDEKETINGVRDTDGCPDKGRPAARIEEGRIALLAKVPYVGDTAAVPRRARSMFNQVARLLLSHPDIAQVEIRVHTDAQGDPDLTQRRADEIRRVLVRAGVDGGRVIARGYGGDDPIADNNSAAGRAKNRRVEILIVDVGVNE